MDFILTELQDNIGIITLNNDRKRNALGKALINELIRALNEMIHQRVRALILRAKPGVKVWSAGFDITDLPQPGRDPLSYYDPLEQAIRAIQRCPAPVIAMMEGSVWGGACELAFVCDLLIGTSNTTFAITPAKIGIPYNPSGILHVLNVLGMAVAKEMFFTAQPLSAERAVSLGILNHLVPAEELEAFTLKLAGQIAANSPTSISVIKEQLRILGNALPLSPETFERIQGLRRLVYDSQDYLEGQRAFLEKRKPVFKGE
ncbi:MAG: methylmalonyl-CoA decarboxylase [Deltaproteobacteria bacterium]|nr:methylmalonyl-CoA decarboxylase [Deltaproteobacteria bacterium]MBI4795608.1 methylmalonyl-CoA decarboxylase [Deltaproteobacteria bacterium]